MYVRVCVCVCVCAVCHHEYDNPKKVLHFVGRRVAVSRECINRDNAQQSALLTLELLQVPPLRNEGGRMTSPMRKKSVRMSPRLVLLLWRMGLRPRRRPRQRPLRLQCWSAT